MTKSERSGRLRPSRRQFLALGAGALAVAALPGALRPGRRLVRRQVPVMGTIAEVDVVARDARWAHAAIDAAVAELRRVDATMSRFRAGSDVGRVNAAPAGEAVPVGEETARVVRIALEWAEASLGDFDPGLAKASALWDVTRRAEPPSAGEIRRYAGRGLWRWLDVGRLGGDAVVVRRDDDVAIDLGGIAKGWGVDRAATALRDWGVADGLVNVGGDLYALGTAEDDEPWEIGIRAPDRPGGLAATFRVSDRAVATSGNYERYFEHGGRRYHHLIDPDTGAPWAGPSRGVTVLAADCLRADAAGTAAFGRPPAGGRRLVESMVPGAEVIHA
ncbi:MAG: FAD:protein FMN transferase [Gemmatimonadota bacterium]|nr:FAD:protein FMN transferase [Gemmatimonadota bacterium]